MMKRLAAFLCLFAALLLPVGQCYAATTQLFHAWSKASAPATSYVQSVQPVSITIASGSTSNTATITSVNTAYAVLVYQGITCSSTSAFDSCATRIALTNGTTVTATRGATNSDSVTINATVIEFKSTAINSVTAGTITMTSETSHTATISAVGAKSFVLYLGQSSVTAQTSLSRHWSAVELTNSTTVTARTGLASATIILSYMVVDPKDALVDSVQKLAKTDTSSSASYTDTITAVVPERSVIFYNGETYATGSNGTSFFHTQELTNGTTVTHTRVGTGTTSRSTYGTVVQFAAGVLNGSVQRGNITFTAQSSNSFTLPRPINTAKAFVNYNHFRYTTGNPDAAFVRQSLSSTAVTANLNTSASQITTAFGVAQFN